MSPNDAACLRYLEQLRWPGGLTWEKCGAVGEPFRLATRLRVLRCRSCDYGVSVAARTVLRWTKTQLYMWLWAAYFVLTQAPGVAALEIQMKLGIARCETAFRLLHKLRTAMVWPDCDQIGAQCPLEMHIASVGDKHKGGVQGKTGRTLVVIAVGIRRREVRDPGTNKIVQRALAGRMRLRKLPNKSATVVDKFAQDCIIPGAVITTDQRTEYTSFRSLGVAHHAVPMGHDRSKMNAWLPMVGVVTANLKAWLDWTFHGLRKQHLHAHLNEFMFRFNRRIYRVLSFRALLRLRAQNIGPTYHGVYDCDWVRRANLPRKLHCDRTGISSKKFDQCHAA